MDRKLTYLALGDSYTIGEAVLLQQSFPYQVIQTLREKGHHFAAAEIIAKTGWTTDELWAGIGDYQFLPKYDFVSLLIGVNNQYRGESKDVYRKEFKELLATAINYTGGEKSHVFVISIPDWGVTPYGKQSGRNQEGIAAEIEAFNAINKEETLAMGISYTDITPASRNAATDGSLVATDGLHPSGKMYLDWAQKLVPEVIKVFK